MSTRHDRRMTAAILGQEILDGPPDEVIRRLAEGVADLTGEVLAGLRNQEMVPLLPADVFAAMCEPPPRLHVVDREEFNVRVPPKEASQ